MTVVVEAGVPLAFLQDQLAGAGQRLSLDPPLGPESAATIGGVVAAGDSGPLRGRFGAARDLVVGITVALSDGTIAKAGGKVIKNVAGYDLAKLFAGSFGSLGLIVELALRLHPVPAEVVSAVGSTADADRLADAASVLSHAPLEHEGLDVRFGGGDGTLLCRFAGVEPRAQAERALGLMGDAGLVTALVEDDAAAWEVQRAGQRSPEGAVVRVSGLQTQLADLCRLTASLGARLVGRAGLGLFYVRIDDRSAEQAAQALERLRRELAPSPCALLDAPPELRALVDPWPVADDSARELMARVRERFDPSGTMSP
jgi:glycolate oxidase FAD binding subunit